MPKATESRANCKRDSARFPEDDPIYACDTRALNFDISAVPDANALPIFLFCSPLERGARISLVLFVARSTHVLSGSLFVRAVSANMSLRKSTAIIAPDRNVARV